MWKVYWLLLDGMLDERDIIRLLYVSEKAKEKRSPK
jgi:hypothetical protein